MLRGESMAGRDSLCQTWDGAIPVFNGKCVVETRLAASGSGESAYF
jgi:hypothetical protein